MRIEDVKVGMKVVPQENELYYSNYWEKAKSEGKQFLYVIGIYKTMIILSKEKDSNIGSLYLVSDFEPYIEDKLEIKFIDSITKDIISRFSINGNEKFLCSEYEVETRVEESVKPKTQKEALELIFNGTDTIAILKQKDGKYKKGISKLHPLDTYNKTEGIKVAVAKALGEDIQENKKLSDYTIEELTQEINKRFKNK